MRELRKEDLLKYDAAVFDFDGTLVDSLGIWQDIDVDYLGELGISVPDDLHEAIAGMSFEETAAYFKKRFSIPDDVQTIMDRWHAMSESAYKEKIDMLPGAGRFLKSLHEKDLPLGLSTSNVETLTTSCLTRFDLDHVFSTMCFTGGAIKGKPDPQVYLLAAENLNVSPANTLAFEDTYEGVLSAKRAGMDVCAVDGTWSEETTRKINALADYKIKDYTRLCAPEEA